MLKRKMLWNLQNGDKVVEDISRDHPEKQFPQHLISFMNSVNLKKKEYPALSPIWRQAGLSLLTLCLMLLIGLVTLGIM
ncbi:hypothetical protein HPG69_004123, partial [Diceros bicornis minor]